MSEQDTPQEGMNPEPEVVEETIVEETIETPEDVHKTYTESQFRQMEARARKAESALRKNSPVADEAKNFNNTLSGEQIEVTVLKAQGVSSDDISYLKKLAAVNGTTLIEAREDELYLSFKAKKESDVKAQKAKLGASKGSGSVSKERSFNTSGLTAQEHKELWKASNE